MPKRISGGQEPKDTLKPDRTRTGIWRNAHSSDVTMTYFLTPGHLNPSEPTSEIKAVRGRSAILRKDGTTTPVNVHVAGDSVKKGRMHIDDGNFQIEFEDAEGSFITGNVVYEGKPAYFAEGYFYGEYSIIDDEYSIEPQPSEYILETIQAAVQRSEQAIEESKALNAKIEAALARRDSDA